MNGWAAGLLSQIRVAEKAPYQEERGEVSVPQWVRAAIRVMPLVKLSEREEEV